MKVCRACGYSCEDDEQFCSKCGEYFHGDGDVAGRTAPATPMMQTMPGMQQHRDDEFSATVRRWADSIKAGTVVDDTTYGTILRECTESIFKAISASGTHSRTSIAELAILIDDRDLPTDLLSGIAERAGRIGYQKELMNTASQYMFLSIDAFGIYTDIDDLKSVCVEAVSVFDSMATRVGSLEPVTSKHDPADILRNYSSFFTILCGKLDGIVASNTPESLERMSDRWAEKSGRGLSDAILAAANMNAQLIVAGKLGSKIAARTRDVQLEMFVRMYTGVQ